MNEDLSKKSAIAAWSIMIITIVLFSLIVYSLNLRVIEAEESGFSCLNAIKVDCNTLGSYPCGNTNEPCCRFYNPKDFAEIGKCAFCTNWEFK